MNRTLPGNRLLALRATFPRHVILLFALDTFTNATDYGFHFFIGRRLLPGDFAIVQTINSILLVIGTTFSVMQPVVARYAAEIKAPERQRAVFQIFFKQSAIVGLALAILVWMGQRPLIRLLDNPQPVIPLMAAFVWLAFVRPVVAGMLQGQERFFSFGLMRTAFAVGRLLLAVIWIGWLGGQAVAGVAVIPLGALISLLIGLAFLEGKVWQRAPQLSRTIVWNGWRLSLAALLAYAAYTTFFSLDLIWVNRSFAPALAGGYATAVVLRRVLALLPGVLVIILYPRIVTLVQQKRLPDKLLFHTAVVVAGTGMLVTAVYFTFSSFIVQFVFGSQYSSAGPILGWMGVAMIGFGIGVIWLNLYLATRPWPFVGLLVALVLGQLVGLTLYHETLMAVTAVFAVTGWLMATGGFLLYIFWLRPRMVAG